MLLKIHVEGETELRFVDRILEPHLRDFGCKIVSVQNRTSPGHYGGLSRYPQFKNNTIRLAGKSGGLVTTMIDLYHLPLDFPGMEEAALIASPKKRVNYLEQRLADDLADSVPFFIPYIQLHEFEALLFSRPDILDQYLSMTRDSRHEELAALLARYRNEPERINSGKGPSVYLEELYPNYRKSTEGIYVAEYIGLAAMRKACPHFNAWLMKLEEAAEQITE